uniref:Uncharacterized protein LOC104232616 n=1 Tax=Nicotiana sylvestris TaxID=4096 RepID=A0A1U7X3A6_NICSY|nr:PREDICTED: uncharacterized protein LOC104232616 [Nicotiana sylvestris]
MNIRSKVDHLILWRINKGNTNFWRDNWSGLGKLAQFGGASTSVKGQISDYIIDTEWNTTKLRHVLPDNVVSQILNITINSSNLVDRPIWTTKTDGKFSCKSAWNCIRTHRNTSLVNKMNWNKKVPFKISFFLWRLLRNRIAVDVNMIKFGISLPSMCSYCTDHKQEDIEHLFLNSMVSSRISKHFNQHFGIVQRTASLRHHIINWWLTKGMFLLSLSRMVALRAIQGLLEVVVSLGMIKAK